MFNPNYGIPLASYGKNDAPTFDNATWFSTVGEPPYVDIEGFGWFFDLEIGWISTRL